MTKYSSKKIRMQKNFLIRKKKKEGGLLNIPVHVTLNTPMLSFLLEPSHQLSLNLSLFTIPLEGHGINISAFQGNPEVQKAVRFEE